MIEVLAQANNIH